MTMIATEVGSAAASKIGEKRQQKKAQRRAQSSAGSVKTRSVSDGTSQGSLSNQYHNAARRSSVTRSVSVGRNRVSTYKGAGGKRESHVNLPALKPPKILSGGGGKVSTLIVEWLIGVAFILWAVFDGTQNQGKDIRNAAHDFFWRFFAWNAVFFVLALAMRGKGSGKFAVMFGGLLDVTIAIAAYNSGSIKAAGDIIKKAPTLVSDTSTKPSSTPGSTPAKKGLLGSASPPPGTSGIGEFIHFLNPFNFVKMIFGG